MKGRYFTWALVAVFAVLSWWSFQRAEARLRANLILGFSEKQGSQIAALGRDLDDQLRQMVTVTNQTLRQVLPDAPADSRVPLAIGSHYLMLGNLTDAVEWYRRANELEPRPEIYLNLGRAEHLAGNREAAVENFRKAVEIDVNLRRSVPEELVDELPPPPPGRGGRPR